MTRADLIAKLDGTAEVLHTLLDNLSEMPETTRVARITTRLAAALESIHAARWAAWVKED